MVTARQRSQSGTPRRRPGRTAPKRFYEQALSEAERAELPGVREIDGLDDEIAVLRLRLRALLAERPDDLTLMFKGIELLTKVVSARYRMSKGDKSELSESLGRIVRELNQMTPEEGSDV